MIGRVDIGVDYYATNGRPACSAGGLVYTNAGSITESFATGAVTGGKAIGGDGLPTGPQSFGLAAVNDGLIGNAYWNKDTAGTATGVGSGTPVSAANGLTTAQMSDPTQFSGWDFSPTGAWAIPDGYHRPILRWQLEH